MFRSVLLVIGCWLALMSANVKAITFEFDYSFDSQGFFDSPESREALQAAAAVYEPLITDSLAAIVPSDGNLWQVAFPNPGSGGFSLRGGMEIPADTLRVFVGGRDLPNDDIGSVDIGQIGGEGTPQWGSIVQERGQPNALGPDATDFGGWGGAMAFDTLDEDRQPRLWNFDPTRDPNPSEYDLFSAALSELSKILGVGTADSYDRWVDSENTQYIGPNSVEVFGGPVPLNPLEIINPTHWDDSVTSARLTDGNQQTALNVRVLPKGTRRELTELDVALLRDIGWETANSPSSTLLPGDANQDLSFDQFDIVRILQSDKYLSGTQATWGDGDWNGGPGGKTGNPPAGDGIFDQQDIIAALQTGVYLTGPYSALASDTNKALVAPFGRTGDLAQLSTRAASSLSSIPTTEIVPPGSGGIVTIPEPASSMVLWLGLGFFLLPLRLPRLTAPQ